MPAAEDVERQIAEAVVIAVEEPPLLMAMQRIVSGVEIERDLRRRFAMGVEEQIDASARTEEMSTCYRRQAGR